MPILWAGLLLAAIPAVSPDAPNRQPQLSIAGERVVIVFGSGKSIRFAQSTDMGETFSKPVVIAELPVLALGRHRGPRVVQSGQTLLVSAIGGQSLATGPHAHGLPSDGDLLLWRSVNGGKTWTGASLLNNVKGSAREGLHAMAADEQGNVAAVWLDLREKGTRLFATTSDDAGQTWTPSFQMYESPDGTICQCCHPSLVALGRGEFGVMFRNALAGNRDMYVLKLQKGKASPAVKAGRESWALNACPMDGGGLAHGKAGLLTAWRRDSDVFLAVEGQPETRIGKGKDIALAVSGSKTFAVWTEGGAIRSWVDGRSEELSPAGAFPTVVALPGAARALAAWEENGSISTRLLK